MAGDGFGKQHARRIGTDVSGDAGQGINMATRIDVYSYLSRPDVNAGVCRQRKRCCSQLNRANSEYKVLHDRVANHSDFDDIGDVGVNLLGNLGDQLIHRKPYSRY